MAAHVTSALRALVARAPAEALLVVAHSAGGPSTLRALARLEAALLPRLRAIAFTDSFVSAKGLSPAAAALLASSAVNFVASALPAGRAVGERATSLCALRSAGHPRHEYASGAAIDEVFALFDARCPRAAPAST
jgi:alpha-beta hydrolase superfamily lysophospholipase